MFITKKPFTAAQFNAEFGPTQMVDWLTVCGVEADRNSEDGGIGEGLAHVRTVAGRTVIPLGHWVVPAGDVACILPPEAFDAMFEAAP